MKKTFNGQYGKDLTFNFFPPLFNDNSMSIPIDAWGIEPSGGQGHQTVVRYVIAQGTAVDTAIAMRNQLRVLKAEGKGETAKYIALRDRFGEVVLKLVNHSLDKYVESQDVEALNINKEDLA